MNTERKQKSWTGRSGFPFQDACPRCRDREPHTFREHRALLALCKIERHRWR